MKPIKKQNDKKSFREEDDVLYLRSHRPGNVVAVGNDRSRNRRPARWFCVWAKNAAAAVAWEHQLDICTTRFWYVITTFPAKY